MGGVGLGIYGVWQVFSQWSSYITSFSLVDASYFGFYVGGIASTTVLLAGRNLMMRLLTVRPDPLYRHLIGRLRKDPVIRHRLGGSEPVPSEFKAYNITGGFQRAPRHGGGILPYTYTRRTVQLVFQISSKRNPAATGTVSCDVRALKLWGEYQYNALAVDFHATGERLLIEGRDELAPFKGVLRLR